MRRNPRLNLILILVLVTANLAVFLPSLSGNFIWDDRLLITENPQLLGRDFLGRFLTSPFGGVLGLDENSRRLDQLSQFYRPLTSLSYWIDFKIWGLNPAGFHLTNILLQALNAVLFFFVLIRLGMERIPSFAGGLLFTVFPLHFENVAWISGRTDLVSFLFAGLSFLFFLKYLRERKKGSLWLSSLFFLMSLLGKENTLFIAGIYLLILWVVEERLRDAVLRFLPFLLTFLFWFGLRTNALSGSAFSLSGRSLMDFFSAFGFYVWKMVLPFSLTYTIDGGRIFGSPVFVIIGLFLILGSIFFAGLLLLKKTARPLPALVWVSFFLLTLPSLLVIFSASTVSFLAWRFLYLPSALLVGLGIFLLWKKRGRKTAAALVCLVLALLYTAEIYPKNKNFGREEKEFWLSVKKPEAESRAMSLFENILAEKDHYLYDRFEQRIYEELAAYYTFHQRLEEAEVYFNRLLQKSPAQSQHFYLTYASFLALKGRVDEGEEIITRMLTLFPENHLVLLHGAKFYIVIKDYHTALEVLKKDYSLFPTEEVRRLLEQVEDARMREKN
jgi:tetratricopeptide (TPR) repeat protein